MNHHDEPPGEIPPPPSNPIQVRVEEIRKKTMGCVHCVDGFTKRTDGTYAKSRPCLVCCDERALLDIIDQLMIEAPIA